MNSDKNAVIPFFLAGLGSGIALTLLLAPRSGHATRNILGRKLKDGQAWIKENAAVAEDYALTNAKELSDRVKNLKESIA